MEGKSGSEGSEGGVDGDGPIDRREGDLTSRSDTEAEAV